MLLDTESGKAIRQLVTHNRGPVSHVGFLAEDRVAIAFGNPTLDTHYGGVQYHASWAGIDLWDLASGREARKVHFPCWTCEPWYHDMKEDHLIAIGGDGNAMLYVAEHRVVYVPTSWQDLEPLFGAGTSGKATDKSGPSRICAWCHASVRLDVRECPYCHKDSSRIPAGLAAAVHRFICRSRIGVLVATVERSYGTTEDSWPSDAMARRWQAAERGLIAAGPAAASALLRALVRVHRREGRGTAYVTLKSVLERIGPRAAAQLSSAVYQLPRGPVPGFQSDDDVVREEMETLLAQWQLEELQCADETPEF